MSQDVKEKDFRYLHLKIKPGQTIEDSKGTRYTNHNPHVAIRITIMFPTKPRLQPKESEFTDEVQS